MNLDEFDAITEENSVWGLGSVHVASTLRGVIIIIDAITARSVFDCRLNVEVYAPEDLPTGTGTHVDFQYR